MLEQIMICSIIAFVIVSYFSYVKRRWKEYFDKLEKLQIRLNKVEASNEFIYKMFGTIKITKEAKKIQLEYPVVHYLTGLLQKALIKDSE